MKYLYIIYLCVYIYIYITLYVVSTGHLYITLNVTYYVPLSGHDEKIKFERHLKDNNNLELPSKRRA